ncbi:MAG: sulfurtransferase [Smithellaceae bacterium]|jgi:thiosulfate/3-mercaptopyruvate sulfurtransferase|nr:sulfurtransferase [Smithellaceae bacterium]MDD3260156.1 sulfurtransferase [Smithellaceae bacterium]MDD3849476.1 sulfurtransferase [Smithellaceae bacterium]HOG11565.1 sulfurtransferase [Smithellaceae bacterium]HOQ71553.1 sulfurtransferase [Smithellaceae bacterium]
MKRIFLPQFVILALFIVLLPAAGLARDITPIVSTDWLLTNLKNPKLVVLDIRRVEDYREGHIPGALNAFYGAWAYMKDGLYASLPEKDEIDDTISYMGINFDRWVVVTGCMDTPRLSYQSARVACTLQYAGIKNVALLDGGTNKWIAEKKPLSTRVEKRKAGKFKGKYTSEKFADKNYVKERLGKLILLDLREREFFTGEKKMDCVPMRGHIPGAFNMPTSCAFNEDRTFKTKEELTAIAEAAAGKDLNAEIVTYCDAGQCCPTWSYLLTEVLGYTNVRLYIGSMQEWMQDPKAPVER